jgi:HK97 family phage prohead protease
MQRLEFAREKIAIEVKSLGEDGIFEGYASVFGNRDEGGDIVERGAFASSLRAKGAKGVKMLADHDLTKRIGVWEEMAEDDRGLRVRGRLLIEKSIGRDAYIDLKAGALDGLSIGYRVKSDAYDGRRRARLLKELDLFEVSLVGFPMNHLARTDLVKSVSDVTAENFREIEAAFRMKGLSRSDAVKAVSGLKEWLQRDAEVPNTTPRDEVVAAELAEILRRNIATLS